MASPVETIGAPRRDYKILFKQLDDDIYNKFAKLADDLIEAGFTRYSSDAVLHVVLFRLDTNNMIAYHEAMIKYQEEMQEFLIAAHKAKHSRSKGKLMVKPKPPEKPYKITVNDHLVGEFVLKFVAEAKTDTQKKFFRVMKKTSEHASRQ